MTAPSASALLDPPRVERRSLRRAPGRLLLAAFDLAALSAAWQLAIWVRENPLESAPRLGSLLLLWVLLAGWLRLYAAAGDSSWGPWWSQVTGAAALAGTLAVMGTPASLSFVLLLAPLSWVTLIGGRCAARATAAWKWPRSERLAVLGSGPAARRLFERIQSAGGDAVRVDGAALLGSSAELGRWINREQPDRIILAEDHWGPEAFEACAQVANRMGVTLSRTVAVEPARRVEFAEAYGLRLLELRPEGLRQELLKRCLDVSGSLLLLVALAPVLAGIAALVWLTSRGGVLHRSQRVGKGGRHFTFLKFRSMYTGAECRRSVEARNEQAGPLFKIRQDPRVTPLGRILRRYSLDELPQLVNVLWGEMSLVGPRPLPASDLDPNRQSSSFADWAEERSRVPPGLSGLWQIRGRSDVCFTRMMELDLDYVRNRSLRLDLRILIETPLAALRGRGAY